MWQFDSFVAVFGSTFLAIMSAITVVPVWQFCGNYVSSEVFAVWQFCGNFGSSDTRCNVGSFGRWGSCKFGQK